MLFSLQKQAYSTVVCHPESLIDAPSVSSPFHDTVKLCTDGGATNSNYACSSYVESFTSFSPPLRCQQRDQCLHMPSEAGLMAQMCQCTLACPYVTA